MKTPSFSDSRNFPATVESATMTQELPGRMVNATEFEKLMVSHRRMERVPCPELKMRGLRDLDTGEVFLTDERRLLLARR
jgi:hypothetical protein